MLLNFCTRYGHTVKPGPLDPRTPRTLNTVNQKGPLTLSCLGFFGHSQPGVFDTPPVIPLSDLQST